MENRRRFAVFVLNYGGWDRKTAPQGDPEELRRFVRENETIRSLPETDWNIFGGPEAMIAERHIPKNLMQDLIAKGHMETVELSAPKGGDTRVR